MYGVFSSLVPVTVASGATASSDITLTGEQIVGIITPPALTSTAISFRVNFGTVDLTVNSSAGTAYSVTVAPDRFTYIDPNILMGAKYIRLEMGSAEAADRVITLVTRPVR